MNYLNGMFPGFFTGTRACSASKAARFKNRLEWCNQFIYYVNLMLDMFKFENLPDTINERYLKMCLLFDGNAAFVNDPEFGYLALRCALGDVYNIYGDYGEITAYGNAYPSRTFKAYMQGADNSDAEAVLIRDNTSMYPYANYLVMLADRLTDTMRSIDVSIQNACFPFIVVADESQKKTIEDLLNKIKNKEPAVIISKGINPDAIKVLTTGFNPSIIESQWDNYNKIENLGRQMLGINSNSEPDKAERLIVDEVNSNNQVTDLSISFRIDTINECLGFVNELFGLNMKCSLNEAFETDRGEDQYVLQGYQTENGRTMGE